MKTSGASSSALLPGKQSALAVGFVTLDNNRNDEAKTCACAPHFDSMLQSELRQYHRKDGSVKEQGPYWYFRYHESGKQKELYLGRTDDPEGALARKWAAR